MPRKRANTAEEKKTYKDDHIQGSVIHYSLHITTNRQKKLINLFYFIFFFLFDKIAKLTSYRDILSIEFSYSLPRVFLFHNWLSNQNLWLNRKIFCTCVKKWTQFLWSWTLSLFLSIQFSESYRPNAGFLHISNVIWSKQPRFPNHLKKYPNRKNERMHILLTTSQFPRHHNMKYTKELMYLFTRMKLVKQASYDYASFAD